MPKETNQRQKERLDQLLDEALEETFPASDPLAIISSGRPGKPQKNPAAGSGRFRRDTSVKSGRRPLRKGQRVA